MEWLNENSGIIVLIASIILVALIGVVVWLLLRLHSKIAVQRLNFLGFYSVDDSTRRRYAGLTIGNKSLNDVGITELGIQNGKVNFPLTEKYKLEKKMQPDTRIVLEQRSSINLDLGCDELRKIIIENDGKKVLKTLRLYAVDLTGTLYRGRIYPVKKLAKEMLAAEKKGVAFVETVGEPAAPEADGGDGKSE